MNRIRWLTNKNQNSSQISILLQTRCEAHAGRVYYNLGTGNKDQWSFCSFSHAHLASTLSFFFFFAKHVSNWLLKIRTVFTIRISWELGLNRIDFLKTRRRQPRRIECPSSVAIQFLYSGQWVNQFWNSSTWPGEIWIHRSKIQTYSYFKSPITMS